MAAPEGNPPFPGARFIVRLLGVMVGGPIELCSYCHQRPRRTRSAELCHACYMYRRKHGTVERKPLRRQPLECRDCGKAAVTITRGCCMTCYMRRRRANDWESPLEQLEASRFDRYLAEAEPEIR